MGERLIDNRCRI